MQMSFNLGNLIKKESWHIHFNTQPFHFLLYSDFTVGNSQDFKDASMSWNKHLKLHFIQEVFSQWMNFFAPSIIKFFINCNKNICSQQAMYFLLYFSGQLSFLCKKWTFLYQWENLCLFVRLDKFVTFRHKIKDFTNWILNIYQQKEKFKLKELSTLVKTHLKD